MENKTSMKECDCKCHVTDGTKHFMSCCFFCSICGKNISFSQDGVPSDKVIETHTKGCRTERR